MPFCVYCGKELSPNDRFCSNCGTPIRTRTTPQVAPPSVVPPTAPTKPKEEILGVIMAERAETQETAYLFLTHNRVIVAPIGDQTLGMVFGVYGMLAESYLQSKKAQQTLLQRDPEQILSSDKRNFAIPSSDIERVEMRRPRFARPAEMHIHTKDVVYRYLLRQKKHFGDYKKLVQTALPNKTMIL